MHYLRQTKALSFPWSATAIIFTKALSVTLADNQSIHVTRLWLKNAPSESYYLAEPIDWQLLDRLIVPRPALRVWFSLPGQDEDSCFFAGVYSMTQTLPDGTVQVLQEPDEGNYSAFGTTGGGRTVQPKSVPLPRSSFHTST